MMYTGIYINLATSTDRAHQMEAQLKGLGAQQRYRRFTAVDGRKVSRKYNTTLKSGELGCWLSHLGILSEHCNSRSHLHIIEDDTLFAPRTVDWLDELLRDPVAGISDCWDLLFTDVFLGFRLTLFEAVCQAWGRFLRSGKLTIHPLNNVAFAGTSSFIVHRGSICRLHMLLEDPRPSIPIDLFIRNMVHRGAINAFVTLPFLTSISDTAEHSQIRGRLDASRSAFDAYRKSLFVCADLHECRQYMLALVRDIQLRPAVAAIADDLRDYLRKKYSGAVPQALISQFVDLFVFLTSEKYRAF